MNWDILNVINIFFRCIICLKNVYIPGFSPWWETFYFWVTKGHLYIYTLDKDKYLEEHYLCLCPKDFKYVKENKLVGEVLIKTRLCQKK